MALTGPDASRHQGTVDWAKVAGAGHDFAIIKATEGTSYGHVDWFERNWPQVKAAGLVPGAYHFLRTSDPAAQARYFVSVVGSFDGALAVLDVETAANGSTPEIRHVRQFADQFRRLVPGHPLIVYTGRWYWQDTIGDPHGADIGHLWHSEYDTGREVDDGPELDNYGGWTEATLWQHTSTGRCPGVSGNCDLNLFYGTRHQLLALAGGPGADRPTTTDVPEEDAMRIADCPDKPALLVGPDGTQKISAAQRTALLRLGVKAHLVHPEDHAALVSLGRARADLLNKAVDGVINLHAAVDGSGLREALAAELDERADPATS